MKFELTKEESDIILNSLPEKRYLDEISYIIFKRQIISDRKNPTGELLPREVDCFKLKIHKGGYRYVYERNSDEWKPISNIVKIKIREEKLKELGI
jgi:hypothetical protein